MTFDGRPRVVVPPGGEVWSDSTGLRTAAQDDIAVSLSVSGTVAPGRHDSAFRTNYLTPPGSGDHTADPDGTAFTGTTGSTLLVSAVDVRNPRLRGAWSPTAVRSSTEPGRRTADRTAAARAPT